MATYKSRHAFGKSQSLSQALSSGAVDAYDILFLDGDTDPKIGWVDAAGVVRMVDTDCVVIVEGEALPETGEIGKVYIFAEEGYFWNGTEFKPVAKQADLTEITTQVSNLENQIGQKVDIQTVQGMIEEYSAHGFEIVEF